ncbi:MAG: hypothetical protein V7L23_20000 [Nostoc sp.]|uniref:hypothetical protein n=1 Tax=Nostoc sp. TaxID=1180 RepID=UPI002FF15DA0
MILNPIKFIEKHPGKAAAMLPVLLVLYIYLVAPLEYQPKAPEQAQKQAPVNDPTDDAEGGDNKPFDRNQCKVYNLGLAFGAWVFQYKGNDGKLNYILFTDNQEVVHLYDRMPFGILWWSSSSFRGYNYIELEKVLPPEGLKALDASLNQWSFAAIGTSAFAKVVQESPNAGVLNTCDVE